MKLQEPAVLQSETDRGSFISQIGRLWVVFPSRGAGPSLHSEIGRGNVLVGGLGWVGSGGWVGVMITTEEGSWVFGMPILVCMARGRYC